MNKKLTCYIVDDELRAINSLTYLLTEYCGDISIPVGSSADFGQALAHLNQSPPDVLFLDIRLGAQTGFDLLNQCDNLGNTQIIIATAHDEYALKAFEHAAVAYMLKPVDPEELRKQLLRIASITERGNLKAVQRFTQLQKERIFISDRNGWTSIDYKDILYLKADNSYTFFKINNGQTIVASKGLYHFEPQLAHTGFFLRIHKSFIINHHYVKRVLRRNGGVLEMLDGQLIPVAASAKSKLMELLDLS